MTFFGKSYIIQDQFNRYGSGMYNLYMMMTVMIMMTLKLMKMFIIPMANDD